MSIPRGEPDGIARSAFTAAPRVGGILFGLFAAMTSHSAPPATTALGATAPAATAPAPITATYGSWASPLSAEALAAAGINFGDLRSVNGRLYWTENVPAAGGTISLFSFDKGVAAPVTSPAANVRTRVHEYGGAPFIVVGDTVYYSQLSDQRLYALKAGGSAVPVTPPNYRYADCIALPAAGDSSAALICVREDHTDAANVRNTLVRLALPVAGAGEVLFEGTDFVAYA
jgi:hypothetical protein